MSRHGPGLGGHPGQRETPKVVNHLASPALGADRLGVVLHAPEGFRAVPRRHEHLAVVEAVIGPRERLEIGMGRRHVDVDAERMVPGRLDVRGEALEELATGMVDRGDHPVLHHAHDAQTAAMRQPQRLEAQTDAKDGKQMRVGQGPQLRDEAHIGGNGGRAWTGTDNDGVEGR